QWRCRACNRISTEQVERCRCGAEHPSQMQFVAFHDCGRLREPHLGRVLCTTSTRSEEHTSELQSLTNLVCRLLLEKKKLKPNQPHVENWLMHWLPRRLTGALLRTHGPAPYHVVHRVPPSQMRRLYTVVDCLLNLQP